MDNEMLGLILGIVAVIIIIAIMFAFTMNGKYFKRLNSKKREVLNDPKTFTYNNLVKNLGGIQNINEVELEHDKLKVISTSLINEKWFKSQKVHIVIENGWVNLTMKGFNLHVFYKRLNKDIKNSTSE